MIRSRTDDGRGHNIGDVDIEESEAGRFYYVWNGNKWLLHREDGPAAEWFDGQKDYYLHSIRYTRDMYWAKKSKLGKILYG